MKPSLATLPILLALLATWLMPTSQAAAIGRCDGDTPPGSARRCTSSILYFNDAHDVRPVLDEGQDRGGVARLKTVLDRARQRNPDSQAIFGGDLAGGTLFGGVYHGHPMVEALNRIGLDVANFGQHDFDFGVRNTRELMAESDFPWVSTNLVDQQGAPFSKLPWTVQRVGAYKVAYLGLTDAMDTTSVGAEVDQRPVIDAARAAVDEVTRTENPDVIIAITQQGLDENKALLDASPRIDLVLTEELAETESRLNQGADGRWILSPEGNLGSVIRVDLTRHRGRIDVTPAVLEVDHTVTPDPELKEYEEFYQRDIDQRLGEQIATVQTPLLRTDNAHRRTETGLGNLVSDSFRAPTAHPDGVGTDIGWIQGGGLRADVPGPHFTLADGFGVLPFGNKVVKVSASGSQVRQGLEQGLAGYENLGGGFPSVSGMTYSFDPARPVGQRVVDVTVAGRPLDPSAQYTVAMTDYLRLGGDGVTAFTDAELLGEPATATVDAEALNAHVRKLGVVNQPLEGRITRL